MFKKKKIFKKKGFLGPDIYTARRAISATGGHGHGTLGSYEISGPYEMRKAVRENIAKGADLIKIMVSGGIMTENEGMQDSQLTDDEIIAALSYIKSRWPADIVEIHNKVNADYKLNKEMEKKAGS